MNEIYCEHYVLEDALIDEVEFCALNFEKCAKCNNCDFKLLKIAVKALNNCVYNIDDIDSTVGVIARTAINKINFLRNNNKNKKNEQDS